jgi:Calcineurin-like phosphoesterase
VHLVNGDLSYANSNQLFQLAGLGGVLQQHAVVGREPAADADPGNHGNEPGNGAQGYLSCQTRFTLPKNHSSDFEGNWYKLQIGSVLFVMLDNNDVCYQVDTGTYLTSGDNQILTGYSGGAQEKWLEQTLRAASTDTSVDWIVAVTHQPAMSTSDAQGSDIGIRQTWMPLFYKYGVDFVLAGHDLHLLPHSGRHGLEPVPGPCRARHVHRHPHPLGRLRLPQAWLQILVRTRC